MTRCAQCGEGMPALPEIASVGNPVCYGCVTRLRGRLASPSDAELLAIVLRNFDEEAEALWATEETCDEVNCFASDRACEVAKRLQELAVKIRGGVIVS